MDNKIDNWAKEALQDREITPRTQVWDTLEKALDQAQPFPAKKPKKPSLTVIIAVLVGLAGIIGYYSISTSDYIVGSQARFSEKNVSSKVQKIKEEKAGNETPGTIMPAKENQEKESFDQNTPEKRSRPQATSRKIHFIPQENTPGIQSIQQKPENNDPGKEEVKKTEKVFAQQTVQQETEVLKNAVVYQPVEPTTEIQMQPPGKNRYDAKKLLAEVQEDMATSSKKYHVNPKELLRVAEKENTETFLNKMLKQVSETSTSVIAMVHNRNVEP